MCILRYPFSTTYRGVKGGKSFRAISSGLSLINCKTLKSLAILGYSGHAPCGAIAPCVCLQVAPTQPNAHSRRRLGSRYPCKVSFSLLTSRAWVYPHRTEIQAMAPFRNRPTPRRLTPCHCLVSVLLLSLLPGAGCRRTSKQIALLTPTTGVMLWDTVRNGAMRESRKCGLSVHYDGPPREDDLQTQIAKFEQASEGSFAAVAIAPIQMKAFRDPIQRASQSGMPIIVIDDDLGIRNSNIAYILTDEQMGGKLAADKLDQVLRGEGNVAIMGLDFSQPRTFTRDQALEQELTNRFKGIHVIERMNGTTNLFQEQQTAVDLLNRSTRIDAIVALNATSSRGLFYALKAMPSIPSTASNRLRSGLGATYR